MQLTDAEIREILIRRKIEKKKRLRRRRRRTIIVLILLIIAAIILVRVLGRHGGGAAGAGDDTGTSEGERGIIFIDPGHGGPDPGSDDGKDRLEKDDTLRLSLAIKDYLKASGFRVEMSRTEDEDVDRARRGQLANECGAQLFISVHRNQSDTGGEGVEGFIPSKDARDSRLLGENLLHSLGRAGFAERTIRAGTLNDPNDDYEEIKSTGMPSVLIEVGFLSSTYDNALFDNNLNGNAKAMANAIELTFMQLHEPEAAAEYEAKMQEAEAIADTAQDAVMQGVDATSEAADIIYSQQEGEGIDPEA